ncbi:MAG: DUF615 domain-containing protein, partial [Clostridiaceae bacterium]|nr:DUF615 domain-containing protein [Clostridiaceae bacterium]
MAKENKKLVEKGPKTQGSINKPDKDKKKGLLFAVFALLTALVVIAVVVVGVSYVIIKNNVNGLADEYRDSIKNIPILKRALPHSPDEEDPENFDKEKLLVLYKQYKVENEE